MSGISKLAGISLLALLILSLCLVSLPTVHSQSTQLVSKLQIANNAVTQANATVMDAEKAGANVTDLIVRLNDVNCVLAKAENNYQTGQFIVADSQLDSTIRLARDLTASAQNAKQTALASNLNVNLQTAAFTAIGSSIFILALSMVWLWLKRKDEPTLKLYKNKFIFLAISIIGLLLIATPALYRIWPGNLISTESSFLIFFLLTGIPIAISAAYGIIIVIYFNKNPKGLCRPSFHNCLTGNFEPLVSVVVATHNEENIISKKIENVLSSDYAANKMEIIFVDDSNDSTSTIISNACEKFPNIHLIRFNERMGYSPSMLAGCKAAHGEIIILSNAGSFMDSHAISKIVDRFEDARIGVVTGNDVTLKANQEAEKSKRLYAKLLNLLRTSETNMDSTFLIKGEATGIRKSAVEDIKDATETFDITAGLHARQKGYKVVYDPQVKFYEYTSNTQSGSIEQKTIRAANLIKVLWRFRNIMFKRKYGKYGSLTLPFNFAALTILPIFILLWFFSISILTFLNFWFFVYVWAAIGVAFLLLMVFSRRLLLTFLQFEYSLVKAIFHSVCKKIIR